jgi:hypothetical protein
MLSKHCIVILRILIGATLFWHTIPRAEAKEIDVVHEAPICKEAQVSEKEDVTPSAKKMQKVAKSHQISEEKDSSGLEEKSCQTSETTQTENTDEPVNSPDAYGDDSNPVDEPANSLPDGGGDQLNFSINLNIGEGSSPDSGVSFPDESLPPSGDPEPSSTTPSPSVPDGENKLGQPQEIPSSRPKPQSKKPHKDKKDLKRDRRKQLKEESLNPSHKEPKHPARSQKIIKDRSNRQNHPQKSDKSTDKNHDQRNLLKDRLQPRIIDKSFIDNRPNSPRQIDKPIRHNFFRPVRLQPNVQKRIPHSLNNRSHFQLPSNRQIMRPRNVFRHSTPRPRQILRRGRH